MPLSDRIPRDKSLDNTLTLMLEGYQFIPNRCRRFQSDIFQTRLMGQKVICMSGEEAAKTFYDNERFQRKGAVPKRIQKTLFGEKGVQTLDDAAHRHRKHLFMSLMTPDALERLAHLTKEQLQAGINRWESMDHAVLFDEMQEILCRVACRWAGVPLKETEVRQRTDDFGNMVDAFGAVGPRFRRGKIARQRAEKWIREVIEQVRAGKCDSLEGTALHVMAYGSDLDGHSLDTQIAAVELINILRPIVAIATYVTFSALALHEHPECRRKLQANENNYTKMFVQEVRRFYPFGPFLGARVRRGFIWKRLRFNKGTLVLLDIYGTNRDPRLWDKPDMFRPERFNDWEGSLFGLIPQGGGDYSKDHRCAGEWVTIKVMEESLDFLTKRVEYDVPVQDLSYSLVKMPTLPKSGFVLNKVRKITD